MVMLWLVYVGIFVFKQKTAYEMRISDWSSVMCSSNLAGRLGMDRRLVRCTVARMAPWYCCGCASLQEVYAGGRLPVSAGLRRAQHFPASDGAEDDAFR